MHIYAFGSVCRGEISPGSDIDMLAICAAGSNDLSRSMFSIYSQSKIKAIWEDGNPFAWHLHSESKLVYSNDSTDFLASLGVPAPYGKAREDCERFLRIYRKSVLSLQDNRSSSVFDLSTAFLGLRNFSTCFLLGRGQKDFSRGVALNLLGDISVADLWAYRIMERARLLCTRGFGTSLVGAEIDKALKCLPEFERRMEELMEANYER